MKPRLAAAKLLTTSLLAASGCTGHQPQQPPPRVERPPVEPVADEPAVTTTLAPDTPLAVELRREARWRIAEWNLAYEIEWSQLESGAIVVCPGGAAPGCDPTTPQHDNVESLAEAIDDLANRHWSTDADEPMALRRGVPMVLPHERNEDIRDIDRMFWALTELDFRFLDGDEGPRVGDLSEAEAEAEVEWLTRRYGLARTGTVRVDWRADYSAILPSDKLPPDQDLLFGIFERPNGDRYLCGRDGPPGKYCCYVYCDQLNGDDRLAEGH